MRPKSATAAPASPELGARIRERRQALRLPQREAASRVGVDRRAYQGWEAGTSGITWDNLDKLATVLEATADWLRLGDEGIAEIAEQRRRGPQPAITRLANDIGEVRAAIARDPKAGASGFIVEALLDIQARLERIEAALMEGGLVDADGDELVDATRQTKAALAEGLDAEDDARGSRSARDTRREGDATRGSAQAPRAGTRRSEAKRAR